MSVSLSSERCPILLGAGAEGYFGIPLMHVEEIMDPLTPRPWPNAPAFVAGLAVWRGATVPVIRLSYLLWGSDSLETRWVGIFDQHRRWVLAVPRILGVRNLKKAVWKTLPPPLGGHEAASLGLLDHDIILLLEVCKAFDHGLWAKLDQEISGV